MEMTCFRLKSIFIKVRRLFAFLSNDIHFFVGTGRGGDCTHRFNLNKIEHALGGEDSRQGVPYTVKGGPELGEGCQVNRFELGHV